MIPLIIWCDRSKQVRTLKKGLVSWAFELRVSVAFLIEVDGKVTNASGHVGIYPAIGNAWGCLPTTVTHVLVAGSSPNWG